MNAQSFAAQCAPVDNVFPIGVRSNYLDSNGFIEPTDEYEKQFYGKYTDENYGRGKPKWQRRIYLKANAGTSGGFSYLRWLDEQEYANAPGLANMLTGDGNLGDGFEEAEWPEGKPGKPDGYPIRPGQFSPGDWVHGNTGLSNSDAVNTQLQAHMDKRTEMILPLIEADAGEGNNATFLVSGFGKFYLRGYGKDQGNRGWYMDLVYLGKPDNVPCTLTNVPITREVLSVKGSVFIRPQEQDIPSSRQPIDYVMLMDTSGSMNWNFAGRAHMSNREVQCTFNPATPNENVIQCNGTPWKTESERRIYQAKQATMSFIDKMEPEDAMTIIGYSSNDYTMNQTGTRQFGTPQGKELLRKAVLDTGKTGSDPYIVGGGTPSPRALMRSREVFAGLPKTAANGKEFKRVVIFLTDGVANHFDKKYNVPWGNNQWSNKATDDPTCTGNNVGENVSCQTGYVNDDPSGIKRPITSMAYHGQQLHNDEVIVYAIMMGAADKTGLDQVASQPTFPWYSTATKNSDVNEIFAAINNNAENGDCIPRKGDWIASIEPQNEPADQPFGWVYVFDQNGVKQDQVPIQHDQTTGLLTYDINGVAPGTYRLEAYVNYKGDDDVERQYSQLFNKLTLKIEGQGITFEVKPSDTLNDTVVGPELNLDLSGQVCTAEAGPSGP